MARREFPRKVMSKAWERCVGQCEKCTAKLFPGHFAYDHIIPDQLGGEATLENCQVLCDNCHGKKTFGTDIPTIRKSDRQRDKHRAATVKRGPRLGKGNQQHSATRRLTKGVGLAYFKDQP